MKRFIYMIVAVAVLAGCEKKPAGKDEPKTFEQMVAGEWHCTPTDIKADIYVSFTSEGGFELYQQITEGAHRLYRGTWAVASEEQGIITGKYNDGEKWASDYVVTFSTDKKTMTLAPVEVTTPVEYVYTRAEIPAEVKENCEIKVKSPYAY